jgi:hypothetical protein
MADEWSMLETEVSGLPAFVRLRMNVKSFMKSGSYRTLLRVVWEYEPDVDYQLPSDEELERLDAFEERLCVALEDDGHAVLAFVMTNEGLRQWLFYVKDVNESVRRINAMPQESDGYPIELSAAEDPEWQEHQALAKSIGSSTA